MKNTPIKIGKVTFIDSFQFMPSSLDSLLKNLSDDQYQKLLRYLKSDYGGNISLKYYFISFVFNAKSFAIAILVFFSFFFPSCPFFWTDSQKLFSQRSKVSYQDSV